MILSSWLGGMCEAGGRCLGVTGEREGGWKVMQFYFDFFFFKKESETNQTNKQKKPFTFNSTKGSYLCA